MIRDDFGTMTVDLKSDLIHEKKYEDAINLIEKIKIATPKFYEKEFPYLSNFAVEYYLYKGDMEMAKAYLQPFIDHPSAGYDMFIPLFNTIRFYKNNDLALDIAQALFEPVVGSSELMGGAEMALVDIIFYNLFQDYYTTQLADQESKWKRLEDILKQYDYDQPFFKVVLPKIHQTLKKMTASKETSLFTKETWAKAVQTDQIGATRDQFWPFAIYMLNERDLPFSTSQDIWFTFFKVLSKGKSHSDFSFHRDDLEEVLSDFFGFLSNREEEGFAILWGIPYIYEFLDTQQLVTQDIKDQSLKQVMAFKDVIIDAFKSDIWRFDFVHTWDNPATVPTEEFEAEKEIFQKSFIERPIKPSPATKQTVPDFSKQMSLFDDL